MKPDEKICGCGTLRDAHRIAMRELSHSQDCPLWIATVMAIQMRAIEMGLQISMPPMTGDPEKDAKLAEHITSGLLERIMLKAVGTVKEDRELYAEMIHTGLSFVRHHKIAPDAKERIDETIDQVYREKEARKGN